MLTACRAAMAAEKPLKLTIEPADQNRRFIVAEYTVASSRLSPPFTMKDESGAAVSCQWEKSGDGATVRWVVPTLSAGKPMTFVLEHADKEPQPAMRLEDKGDGSIAVLSPAREITRYWYKPAHNKHQKPYFYPLIVQGVPITRAFPMEKKAGEAADHAHHSSIYFAHGEVNGKDYWSKVPITHSRFIEKVSGPTYARIVAENSWGKDLTETQDITLIDAGQDAIFDWVITLKAENGPVHLGKTKEGGFSVRVAQGLVDKSGGKMVDAKGNKGEPAIRKDAAVWADNYGTVDGKLVGVAVMNHPTSWRHPTNWHVRGYGLFAANAFFEAGEHSLAKGDSITLKYRIYAHGGTPEEAKVAEVYAGYAGAKVKAED